VKADKKIVLISMVFIVGIVMISGCIGQTVTVMSNDGLRIVSFDASETSVDVGQTVAFTLSIENVGYVDATDVEASLNGIENTWRTSLGADITDMNSYSKKWKKLYPPNPKYNQPGDQKTAQWVFKTPVLAQGLNADKTVDAAILYNYKTTGTITIQAVGETFYKTNYVAKGKSVGMPVVTNTNAPVKLLMPESTLWANYFMRVDDAPDAELEQEKPIQIVLKNVGSGFPITDGVPGRIYGNITLQGPAKFKECLGFSDTNKVQITPGTLGADLAQLQVKSGEVPIHCTIAINKDIFMKRPLPDEPITMMFDLDYRYYITQPVIVQVNSYK
jgi:hypothetical protein